MEPSTGSAQPAVSLLDEADLEHNRRAAAGCPAKKDRGVIHVVDRCTEEEIAPDPAGDGSLSVDGDAPGAPRVDPVVRAAVCPRRPSNGRRVRLR